MFVYKRYKDKKGIKIKKYNIYYISYSYKTAMTVHNLDFRGRLGSVTSFLSIFFSFVRRGVDIFRTKSEVFLCNFSLFLTFLKKNEVARDLIEIFGGFGGDKEEDEEEEKSLDSGFYIGSKKRDRDDITKYPKFYLEEVRAKQSDKQSDKKDEDKNKEEDKKEKGEEEKDYEQLKNNFVFEKTPMGNVIMYYNKDRNSFEYYTDNIIPYRILDTVARKYVLTYDCCELYVDMEKEIKEYIVNGSNGGTKEKKEKKVTFEMDENEEKAKEIVDPVKSKPNVFAKFKSYNKDSSKISDVVGGGGAGGGGGAKDKTSGGGASAVVNTSKVSVEENEKILLKEKANVYTCLGKFANFSMLKKVDRTVVDKNYTMSFAEYKKMMASSK